jgi:O-methyltransferase
VQKILKKLLKETIKLMGYEIVKIQPELLDLEMIDQGFIEIYKKCRPYTIISQEEAFSLYKAVKYVVKYNIPGDMVECGVFKGGSTMLMALTLMKMGEFKKSIYLYDTYEGMSRPTDKDMDFTGKSVMQQYVKDQNEDSCPCAIVH